MKFPSLRTFPFPGPSGTAGRTAPGRKYQKMFRGAPTNGRHGAYT
jgi:hypothetical protein